MKKILYLFAAVALSLTAATDGIAHNIGGKKQSTFSIGNGKERIEASGNIVSETRKAAAFHAIEAGPAVKVVVGDYPEREVTVEADDNILSYVKIDVEEGRLKIGYATEKVTLCDPHATIYVSASGVTQLKAQNASKIITKVSLTGDNILLEADSASKIEASVNGNSCEIKCNSVAKITAAVVVASLTAEADSVAKITVKGKAGKCRLKAVSVAKIDASGLEAGEWETEASSLAKISR